MLNLKSNVPVKEELSEELQFRVAQIRDLLLEIEQIQKLQLEAEDICYTREELAHKFKCDPKKIPRAIPSFRVSRNILYKKSDVDAFIKARMTKR